ncbi:MAG: c-type cytochrome [Burkholderiales bacterium]|nr:c-type cytochrome [Burkholderiales bacterium]
MRVLSTAALLGASLLATAAGAQTTAPPAGRLLASNCFQCHGTNGAGPGFDNIAGKSVDEIYKELREMKSEKPGNDIMKAHARGYTDEQLRQISAYLSQQRSSSSRDD